MIAFDFDNTLCMNEKDSYKINEITVNMINKLSENGIDVCIVTARMSPKDSPSYGINEFYDKIYDKKYISVDGFIARYLNFNPLVYYTNGKYKAKKLLELKIKILVDDNSYEREEADKFGIIAMKPNEARLLEIIIGQ